MSGYDEIKFNRRVHSGLPSLLDSTQTISSVKKNPTNITHNCMLHSYENLFLPFLSELIHNQNKQTLIISRYLRSVFSCWSGAALYNNPGKSSDLLGRCPCL